MELESFYKGKKVLITGHTGFKGTWLSFLLDQFGTQIYGYSLPPERESLYVKAHPVYQKEIFSDVRDKSSFSEFICKVEPDIIFHLAAHSTLDRVLEIPYSVFEINVMGTAALMDCVRKFSHPVSVVVVTSDKCYLQDGAEHVFHEQDPLGAADPYSTSKACQDLVVQSFLCSFQELSACTARASNTVGGGDGNMSRLLPYLIKNFSDKTPAVIRNPNHIRPWQYVLDVLHGYLILGKHLYTRCEPLSSAYNFGPSPDGFQTVHALADKLADLFHAPHASVHAQKAVHEAPLLKLCSDRANRELGWIPYYSFEQMLEEVVQFNQEEQDVSTVYACRSAISRFLSRLER
ncbi:CDP-glucose 4,6-dehydratase [Intestinimonas butyriciproducens]|uniref:CDP-glucose 4,6-dehydratase n=1 Tax=Intestinimonas butyriciproducens TaxID=1297617 RepID=UPI001957A2AE|nr:CDP-glucose 4,6-dehydratase [Intestinimonas butyriciproducens]MBM6974935.1 CDP-glucose 4,6-dehydratase [Intestinimonas butyriciproducens]